MSCDLHFLDQHLPAAELAARVQRAKTVLLSAGVGEGDGVALMLHNRPETLELMIAVRDLGALWCPINWHFRSDELAYILRDAAPKLLVIESALLDAMPEAVPDGLTVHTLDAPGEVGSRSAACPSFAALRDAAAPDHSPLRPPRGAMFYTSGTTGRPKGIRRNPSTPEQVASTIVRTRLAYGLEAGCRALMCAPMYHSAPNAFSLSAAQQPHAQLWIEPRFDPERVLQLIERHRITHAYLVPTMYVRMLRLPEAVRQRYDLSSMQVVSATGSACPPEVKRAMIDWWGPVFREAYGSSELGYMTTITSPEALEKPGSAGRALPGVELKILDEADRELPAGERGIIYARCVDAADFTYQGNDAARRAMERDGFKTMGDVGYLDADGYLFIVDRVADMVISGGVNIYPAEIEQVLIGMPGVHDCAVFGIPDDEIGEQLAAAIQPDPDVGLTPAQVQGWLRERLAGYKVPHVVAFHGALPREDTGKIFKRKLREPYWAGRSSRVV